MKERSELSSSKAGTAAWWPGLACSVSSREAKAPNSAGLEFRGTSSPSPCSRNSTGAGDQGRRLGEGFVAREAEDGGGAEVADRQSGVHRVAGEAVGVGGEQGWRRAGRPRWWFGAGPLVMRARAIQPAVMASKGPITVFCSEAGLPVFQMWPCPRWAIKRWCR